MPDDRRHPLTHYGIALVLVILTGLLASQLESMAGVTRFLFSTGAIVVIAWIGGFGPGALATLFVGALTFAALHRDPSTSPGQDSWLTGLFLLEGLVISAAGGLRHRAERAARLRVRQNAALAALSRWTLGKTPTATLFQDAAELVLGTLAAERVEITSRACGGAHALAPRAGEAGAADTPSGRLFASIPLAGAGRSLGTLEVRAGRPRRAGVGDLDFLHSVANLLSAFLSRRHADQEAERLSGRAALLADVGTQLSVPLDSEGRVGELARIIVPRLADWCVIDGVEETGELRRLVVYPAEPGQLALTEKIHAASRGDSHPAHPTRVALETESPRLIARLGDPDLRCLARDAAGLETLRRAGLHSLMCIPLRARGRTIGALTFAATVRPPYDAADLALAEEVAARAALALDNARLYEKLLAEDRAKDEFIGLLAHELRNPLAPMVHSLEVLRVASPDSEARERARRVLERQIAQLRHLVRDLLDLARITRGTIELHRESIDAGAAVMRAVESSHPAIEAHRHVLVSHLPPGPTWIDADPVRLDQILTNLIQNAVGRSRPGTRTDFSLERDEDVAILRLKDNGAGFTPDQLPRVFDLASGGDVLEHGPGAGFGLYLVRRLVEMHGGTIQARSAGLGHGSEFIVQFPISRPAGTSPRPPAGPATGAERVARLRVLVVDDHMDSAAALSELLALWGYEVRTAVDGREALQTSAAFRPDLVLLDLAMPDMNGYQVGRQMRRMPELSHTTLAALTGHGRETTREKSGGFEFDRHWIKPLDVQALRAFLEEQSRHRHDAFAS